MGNHSKGNAAEKPARTQERRRKSRTLVSTPVRVRGVEGSGRKLDESTTTVNLSSSGILIETNSAIYTRNMKVLVTIAGGAAQTERQGQVVRITDLREGRRSVAIALAHAAVVEQTSARSQNSLLPLVLVLESESAASDFMRSYLSSEGYEVVTVETVAEARSVLEERTPSLLIAEIEGEGMPGYSLCSHCKETPRLKPIPIMLMTSSAYPSDYAKAHSMGAVVCMAKPFKRERLGHVVKLLAPPPNASQDAPPHAADPSRHSPAKQSKTPAPVSGRRFSLPSVFGR
jgi:CheY-like chemotaxis protein